MFYFSFVALVQTILPFQHSNIFCQGGRVQMVMPRKAYTVTIELQIQQSNVSFDAIIATIERKGFGQL
jgi:hypothetical protein